MNWLVFVPPVLMLVVAVVARVNLRIAEENWRIARRQVVIAIIRCIRLGLPISDPNGVTPEGRAAIILAGVE